MLRSCHTATRHHELLLLRWCWTPEEAQTVLLVLIHPPRWHLAPGVVFRAGPLRWFRVPYVFLAVKLHQLPDAGLPPQRHLLLFEIFELLPLSHHSPLLGLQTMNLILLLSPPRAKLSSLRNALIR